MNSKTEKNQVKSSSINKKNTLPRLQIKGNIQWYFIAEYLGVLQDHIIIEDSEFDDKLQKLIEYAQNKMQLPDGDIADSYVVYELLMLGKNTN